MWLFGGWTGRTRRMGGGGLELGARCLRWVTFFFALLSVLGCGHGTWTHITCLTMDGRQDTQPCSAYFPGSYRASPYIPFLLHTPPDMANCPPPKAPRTLPEVSHGVHRPGYWCAV
ncbi:hypothetical protein BC938DRAFT_474556 [Jimgerdemannia flammicorona]|uniref:Uncharacterized protein n=1 Tax=Jimgerdemannia flammicorona TaxID=994334 RepID=A0A433Q200_9FUNG|nr:hypothetical protein BC938DRAFT_474556 [Jimgerdemannia flammicorona]